NAAIDREKPWEIAKDATQTERLHRVCSDCIHAFRRLTLYLAPVLPRTAEKAAGFLGLPVPLRWSQLNEDAASTIQPYAHLMQRVDPKMLDTLFDALPATRAKSASGSSPEQPAPNASEITIEDFAKLDLRI